MADPIDELGELGSQRKEQERNKGVKVQKQQADEGLRWLMGDERGRRFVWEMLTRTRLWRLSHGPHSPEVTAFNEGHRNIGLELLADVMRIAPEQYPRMQAEAHARATPKKNEKDTDNG